MMKRPQWCCLTFAYSPLILLTPSSRSGVLLIVMTSGMVSHCWHARLQGDLRIAHCGGFHSALDRLVTALNVLAKLLHHPIQWDSETIGCQPSLSSIPAAEQRTLLTAMQELADWLAMPQNQHEFLVVFLDDQMDLAAWVWRLACALQIANACCNIYCYLNIVCMQKLSCSRCCWCFCAASILGHMSTSMAPDAGLAIITAGAYLTHPVAAQCHQPLLP